MNFKKTNPEITKYKIITDSLNRDRNIIEYDNENDVILFLFMKDCLYKYLNAKLSDISMFENELSIVYDITHKKLTAIDERFDYLVPYIQDVISLYYVDLDDDYDIDVDVLCIIDKDGKVCNYNYALEDRDIKSLKSTFHVFNKIYNYLFQYISKRHNYTFEVIYDYDNKEIKYEPKIHITKAA